MIHIKTADLDVNENDPRSEFFNLSNWKLDPKISKEETNKKYNLSFVVLMAI